MTDGVIKWFITYDCVMDGVLYNYREQNIPDDQAVEVGGYGKVFTTEQEARDHLRNEWLCCPETGTIEIPYVRNLARERELDKFFNEFRDRNPGLFAPSDSNSNSNNNCNNIDSINKNINSITVSGSDNLIRMITKRGINSCDSDDDESYNKETIEDSQKRENYITEVLETLPFNEVTKTRFRLNEDCCALHIYKYVDHNNKVLLTMKDVKSITDHN